MYQEKLIIIKLNIIIFNILYNETLLQEFIEYSVQDSVALLKALLKAQEIYIDKYNIDISSELSTSTLSLKIFRKN